MPAVSGVSTGTIAILLYIYGKFKYDLKMIFIYLWEILLLALE